MGIVPKIKFWIRLFLFLIISFLVLYDPNIINKIIDYKIFWEIRVIHIIWVFLMYEVLEVMIPGLSKYTYNGKHFLKHFNPEKNYDMDKFNDFYKKNVLRAFRSLFFWIVVNIPFAVLFFMGIIGEPFMFWLFFAYYFADVFCINVFCIFHLFITKNKCCNECRIYNWDHLMYCTPLIFIPNFWTYSLIFVSLLSVIQWEYLYFKYPERFSPVTNKNLQCIHCQTDCRFKKNNRLYDIIGFLKHKKKVPH